MNEIKYIKKGINFPPFAKRSNGIDYALSEDHPSFKSREEAMPIIMQLKEENNSPTNYVRLVKYKERYFIYKRR